MKIIRFLQVAVKVSLCSLFIFGQVSQGMACKEGPCDGSCEMGEFKSSGNLPIDGRDTFAFSMVPMGEPCEGHCPLGLCHYEPETSNNYERLLSFVEGPDPEPEKVNDLVRLLTSFKPDRQPINFKEKVAWENLAKGLLETPGSCTIPSALHNYFGIEGIDLFDLNPKKSKNSKASDCASSEGADKGSNLAQEYDDRVLKMVRMLAARRLSGEIGFKLIEKAKQRVREGDKLGQLGLIDQAIEGCGTNLLKRAYLEIFKAGLMPKDPTKRTIQLQGALGVLDVIVPNRDRIDPQIKWNGNPPPLEDALARAAMTLGDFASKVEGESQRLCVLQIAAAVMQLPLHVYRISFRNPIYSESTGHIVIGLLFRIKALHESGVDSGTFVKSLADSHRADFAIYGTAEGYRRRFSHLRSTGFQAFETLIDQYREWGGQCKRDWFPWTHALLFSRKQRQALRTMVLLAKAWLQET